MKDSFKVFVDRLKYGSVEKIDESVDPSFMDIHEKELKFQAPIVVKGEAYLADQDLILDLSIETECLLPCLICNQDVQHEIAIPKLFVTEPLSQIKSHVFDFQESVREAVLLELPLTVECHDGNCPERKSIEKYMAAEKNDSDDSWQPFKDL